MGFWFKYNQGGKLISWNRVCADLSKNGGKPGTDPKGRQEMDWKPICAELAKFNQGKAVTPEGEMIWQPVCANLDTYKLGKGVTLVTGSQTTIQGCFDYSNAGPLHDPPLKNIPKEARYQCLMSATWDRKDPDTADVYVRGGDFESRFSDKNGMYSCKADPSPWPRLSTFTGMRSCDT